MQGPERTRGEGETIRKTVQKFTRLSSKINLTKRGRRTERRVDEENGRSGDDGGGVSFEMNQLRPPHLLGASAAINDMSRRH